MMLGALDFGVPFVRLVCLPGKDRWSRVPSDQPEELELRITKTMFGSWRALEFLTASQVGLFNLIMAAWLWQKALPT